MATIGTLFGWLGDIVGTHVFVNGVPQALRRRWNFIGGVAITDDEAGEILSIAISGGSNLTGPGGTIDVASSGVAIDSVGDMSISAPNTTFSGDVEFLGTVSGVTVDLDPSGSLDIAATQADPVTIGATGHRPDCAIYSSQVDWAADEWNLTALGAVSIAPATTCTLLAGGAVSIQGGAASEFIGDGGLSLQVSTSGTIRIGDGFGDGDLATACIVNATSITVGGNCTAYTEGNASCVRITSVASWTVNGVRIDYARVAKADGATLDIGKYNELTGSTWTLPALSGVNDGARLFVVHSLSSGTISRAGADVIDAGSGHTTDTTFALAAGQGIVEFRKVDGKWRLAGIGGSGGAGSGASIADAGASVDTTGGDVVATVPSGKEFHLALDGDERFAAVAGSTTVDAPGDTVAIGPNAGTVAIGGGGADVSETGDTITHTVGSSNQVHDISGANRRVVTQDAAGSTACTDLYDNAACSRTVPGTYDITSTGNCSITGSNVVITSVGISYIYGPSGVALLSNSGPLTVYAGSRLATFEPWGGVGPRMWLQFPAPVTPGSNAATNLGSVTVKANKLTRVTGTALARLSTGNAKTFAIDCLIDADGTTATVTAAALATQIDTVGTCQGSGAGAPLAGSDFTTSVSGLAVTFRVANAQGVVVSLDLRVDGMD